jgi:hypothetical protein
MAEYEETAAPDSAAPDDDSDDWGIGAAVAQTQAIASSGGSHPMVASALARAEQDATLIVAQAKADAPSKLEELAPGAGATLARLKAASEGTH